MMFASHLGGRWAVAAAMAWGLLWIAYGRAFDAPESGTVAVAAVVAAVVVLLAASRVHSRRAT